MRVQQQNYLNLDTDEVLGDAIFAYALAREEPGLAKANKR